MQTNRRNEMNRWILGSVAAAAFTFGIATASAQLSPGPSGALTPEQRSAVRAVIAERLTDEMRNRLPEGLAEAAAAVSNLTPEQRTAIRSAIRARLGDDVNGGLAVQLSDRLADRLGNDVQLPRAAALSPEQKAAIRSAISERLGEDMRERIADGLADAASKLAKLTPEQRTAVLGAIRAKLGNEIKDRIGDRLAEEISQKLSDRTVGSGSR
jgi:Arc/MetJ family transcription regulator